MPSGTLTNSTHRHDTRSVSRPPAIRPTEAPAPITAESTANARARAWPSKLVTIRAIVPGAASAAPRSGSPIAAPCGYLNATDSNSRAAA
jgi:hypothetical protein